MASEQVDQYSTATPADADQLIAIDASDTTDSANGTVKRFVLTDILTYLNSGLGLAASKITSGALALARGGTGADLSASGGTTKVLTQDASHVVSARDLVAGDIPSLAASKITSGQVGLAQGGSNADLSATGGANQVVRQNSAGGAFTVSTLAAADIPSLAASKITSGTLAIAQGGTNAATAAANTVFAGPTTGADAAPSFRAPVAADIPSLDAAKVTTGTFGAARVVASQALTDGTNIAWDTSLGAVGTVTLAGSRTFSAPSNLVAGASYALKITQDGSGNHTAAWNSVFKWSGGTTPALSTAAGAIDIATFISDGTNLYGSLLKAFA